MNKLLAVLVVLLVIVGVAGILLPSVDVGVVQGPEGKQGPSGPQGPRGPQGPQGPRGLPGESQLGAVTGPVLSFPFWEVNGLRTWSYSSGMRQATSTPCAFKSPAATTTSLRFSARFDTASTAALTVTLATSTSPNATTSVLAQGTVKAEKQGSLVFMATSTNTAGDEVFNAVDAPGIIGPNTWFVLGISGGTKASTNGNSYTGLVPVGSCRASVVEL